MNDPYSDRQVSPPSHAPITDTTDLRSLFRRTFASVAPDGVLDLSALHQGVCTFVRIERERGARPEQVLTALKALMAAEVQWNTPSYEQRNLRDALIRWCLDEYYGPPVVPSGAHQHADRAFRIETEGMRPNDRR